METYLNRQRRYQRKRRGKTGSPGFSEEIRHPFEGNERDTGDYFGAV
ncbi:MAG: hypothetical protein SWE60_01160 [Thermodesulfobacteriota bacterium]|nr:hypothetical protein [Thermodesulfobacteriota bacterium]